MGSINAENAPLKRCSRPCKLLLKVFVRNPAGAINVYLRA
jgi:hypothetical protein